MENESATPETEEIKEEKNQEAHLGRVERRKLKRLQIKEERKKERKQRISAGRFKTILFIAIAVVIVSALGFLFYRMSSTNYDAFAQCLTSKGAVIYGNNWCSYTQEQRRMFGDSFKYLNYKVCDENKQLCKEKGVSITPTWEIDEKIYSGIQSLQTLSRVSGCSLK